MRRLIYYISITTDGMYADEEGGLDFFVPTDEEHRYANELVRDAGDAVMGRRMYDIMDYWDQLDLDDPNTTDVEREFATFWRDTPKHVASRGRPDLRANARLIDGDVVDFVRHLKSTEGPDIMLGAGADLFAELTEAGLIDEYRFLVVPIALGKGKALFGSLERPLELSLTDSHVYPSGSILLEYERRDERRDAEEDR